MEIDGPSSVLAGEAFLGRIYEAVRSSASAKGSNAFNTMLLVSFDEPGGTYDHVPPGPGAAPGSGGGWKPSSGSPSTVRATGCRR